MSIQAAHRFITRVAKDPGLRQRVADSGKEEGLQVLVSEGAGLGLRFTVPELREAFALDTAMRAVFYRSGASFSGVFPLEAPGDRSTLH